MKVLVVFNHPYEGSYCNAILDAITRGAERAGHELDLVHLDRDDFDPVMRAKDLAAFVQAWELGESVLDRLDPQVQDYAKRLLAAEHLVFVFPIWWELMPALTKGFVDKVIFPGVAYDYAGASMKSRLSKLRGLTVVTTMNTPAPAYRLLFGNAVQRALVRGTFWKIGCPRRKWINLSMVKFASRKRRERWLDKIETRFAALA